MNDNLWVNLWFADRLPMRPEHGVDNEMCRSISVRNVKHSVDFDLFSSYLQKCDNEHHHDHVDRSSQEIPDMRYIDIHGYCVVKKAGNVRYAALSYTWLSAKQFCLTQQNVSTLEKPNSLRYLSSESDRVVLDLIEVCQKLNILYAWIDRLCIIQDDVKSKHRQIQNMDQIYANAYITVVSAPYGHRHISNSFSKIAHLIGLPRVSSPVVSNQLNLSMDGITYSILPVDLCDRLAKIMEKSEWFTRGCEYKIYESRHGRKQLNF